VTRGVIHPPKLMTVSDVVQDEFGFAETQVVSFEDLYGGKLHVALDRQHPSDLFDVKLLYEHEGLNPNLADLEQSYAREFLGMTRYPVSLGALIAIRALLIGGIVPSVQRAACHAMACCT
jgi:hypothetical protein